MHLLRRIAISKRDKKRKEAATEAIVDKDQEIIANWNQALKDEVWQKIVEALAARGFPAAEEDLKKKRQ
jgi:DNA-binding MurR/RpiR family transcriptional regulator